MHNRRRIKLSKRLAIRGGLSLVLVLALCVSSFAAVTANTVSANVIDGDNAYSFPMLSTDLDTILAQAESQGMPSLEALDTAERVQNTTTVYVRRGVNFTVNEAGRKTQLVAYEGETVEEALLEGNILLKEADEVSPSLETVITADTSVEIVRACTVIVTADGKSQTVSLSGATVGDALKKAGVTLGKEDSVSFPVEEPLFEKMNIRVARVTKITVTADGKTKEYKVAAQSVAEALKKCGVSLGEEDRLSCKPTDKLKADMKITIQRVSKEETKVTEEIPYETVYEDTDELYDGETRVKTEGVAGEKEVCYEVLSVDGKEESKTVLEEKILKEPVTEVILRGISEEQEEPDGGTEDGTEPPEGTFIDCDGNVVSYSRVLTGDCTAAYIPGGTTSIGMVAEYGVIAVNPDIIPYGTRLYVASPDGSVVYGYGVAGDTGGACMSGLIIADLYYNTLEECSIIGRRVMNVYVLS